MSRSSSGRRAPLSPSNWEKVPSKNSKHLEVSNLRVKYIGPGSHDRDAASVRANTYTPPSQAIYYFEVTVVSSGHEGYIGVGFCTADVNMDRLPGWEPQSYGYHGDDGNVFRSDGKGRRFGPLFGTGDVIGALLNRAEQTISYYKNGIELGTAFQHVMEERLYPCVGMQTQDEEILANFGDRPFQADVEAMKAEARQRMHMSIAQIDLPCRGKRGSLMGELLFGYLVHHACWDTASAVARDMLDGAAEVSPEEVAEVRQRAAVAEAVVAGRIDEAVGAAEALAPGVLAAHPRVRFRLHAQKFMELVRVRDDEGAMAFGRAVLVREARSDEDMELLQDALSLLGYDDPATSPCGNLLGVKAREDLAQSLTAAILSHTGRQQESALERIYQQLGVTLAALHSSGAPVMSLFHASADRTSTDVQKFLPGL